MFKKTSIITILLLGIILLPSWKKKKPTNSSDTIVSNKWVDSVFQSLTPDERLGQLFMIAAYSNQGHKHQHKIKEEIAKNNIGGLIFMQGGPGRQARLLNEYQSLSKVPLLVSMDAEWGLGMRLDSTIHFPKQMTLGALQDNRYIYRMGQEIARQCKRIGMQVNFAPVVDVNVNPKNPVIGMRSFGENKEKVAEKGIAYMKGMQSQRVLANAKHFPGHGDTDKDSHKALPIITHDKERLDDIELYPFKRLIHDSLASMMVAHLYVPSLDDTKNRATTLSPKVVTKLLKEEMGFRGLIFTDALGMKGVSNYYAPGEVDLEALLAGNDVLLFSADVSKAKELIKQAIANKKISQKEVDNRVKKILYAKYWSGLNNYQPIAHKNLTLELNNHKAKALRETLFEKAMTVVRTKNKLVPIQILDTNTFASISIGMGPKNNFQTTLSKYAPFSHYHLSLKKASEEDYNYVFNHAIKKKIVVVGLHGLNNSASKNFGINHQTIDFLKSLSMKTEVILSVFGNPYSLKNFDFIPHIICTYEENETTRKLAPQLIFGAFAANGKLPVTSSPSFKEGSGVRTKKLNRLGWKTPARKHMDWETLKQIDTLIAHAIADSATPGCQLVVARDGAIVYEKAYGYHTYEKKKPISNFTLFDIASVTKVSATLQAVMFLVEQGELELDATVTTYLPSFKNSNKAFITLREVLTHQAGLVPFIPFWAKTKDDEREDELSRFYYRDTPSDFFSLPVANNLYISKSTPDSIWQWIIEKKQLKIDKKTKTYPYRYSDLGYYILQRIVETKTQQPLNQFVEQNFYLPLGMSSTGFNPLNRFPKDSIAPTENDLYFRKSQIHGTVHDQGAAMMGGVAGHAGIFTNAVDLTKVFQMNLQQGEYGGQNYLHKETLANFTSLQYEENRRGLGWDKPECLGRGPTGELASPQCFGHSGFTGTGAWVDPDYNLIYVFLSNRIYPDAENRKLLTTDVRTRVHDLIYMSIMNYNDELIN